MRIIFIFTAFLACLNASATNVLIIGDSISIGWKQYGQPAGVTWQYIAPGDNCGNTAYTLSNLEAWLAACDPFDEVICNWGLHDLDVWPSGAPEVTISDYISNMTAIFERLKEEGKPIYYLTTTPVTSKPYPWRAECGVELYNYWATQVCKAESIPVFDLWAAVFPTQDSLHDTDGVHFTPTGYNFIEDAIEAWWPHRDEGE